MEDKKKNGVFSPLNQSRSSYRLENRPPSPSVALLRRWRRGSVWQMWMEEASQAQGFDPMSGQKTQSPPPNSDCWIRFPDQVHPLCY